MRRRLRPVILAFVPLLVATGSTVATPAADAVSVNVIGVDGNLVELAADGPDAYAFIQRSTPPSSTLSVGRLGASGFIEPPRPFLDLPVNADLQGVKVVPTGGMVSVFNTRGDGFIGNELHAVVDVGGSRTDQRLNPPSTQASQLFWDAIAVGPTGTLAVPFVETTLPYGTEEYGNYSVAVRPAGATTFRPSEPIFPRGAQGNDVMRGRTFLGPDGGGWIFLLPSGDDWRSGEPVVVLARRIQPNGELGVLLRLRVPISKPVNTDVTMAARFDASGRLVAAFAASGYTSGDQERAVAWTHAFTAATAAAPSRSMVVDRRGGYGEDDNIDIQLDDRGRATVIARSRQGLQLFRQHGAGWRAGPRLATRLTFTSRLLRLADGRVVAVWLQPYNRQSDRSQLMVATGSSTASRWRVRRVQGLGRPGLMDLDGAVAFGDDRLAAALTTREERVVVIRP